MKYITLVLFLLGAAVSTSYAQLGEAVAKEKREKIEKLKKFKPDEVDGEIGVWLDDFAPTIPFYVQIIRVSDTEIIIKKFFTDGSGGEGEKKALKDGRIQFGNSAGDHYRLKGSAISVWDSYGKVCDLKLIRSSKRKKKKG